MSGVVYEQMSAFSHSQPSPQPLSQRERGLAVELSTAPRGCSQFILDAAATQFFYTISGYSAVKRVVFALTPTPLPEGEGLVRRIVNTP